VLVILAWRSFHKREEEFISLKEIIPQARIVSETEGILEYMNVRYILGTGDLKVKKVLIDSLKLLSLENLIEVDMRFSRQIIIRTKKISDEKIKKAKMAECSLEPLY